MIRAVDPDARDAREIHRAYITDVVARWHGRDATKAEVDRTIADEPSTLLRGPTGIFVLAERAGVVLGCAGFTRIDDDTVELTKVFTRPSARGQGIAVALVSALESEACRRGARCMRLDTRSDLTAACALYERLGYERVEAFSPSTYSDRWYAKSLPQPGSEPGADGGPFVRQD